MGEQDPPRAAGVVADVAGQFGGKPGYALDREGAKVVPLICKPD